MITKVLLEHEGTRMAEQRRKYEQLLRDGTEQAIYSIMVTLSVPREEAAGYVRVYRLLKDGNDGPWMAWDVCSRGHLLIPRIGCSGPIPLPRDVQSADWTCHDCILLENDVDRMVEWATVVGDPRYIVRVIIHLAMRCGENDETDRQIIERIQNAFTSANIDTSRSMPRSGRAGTVVFRYDDIVKDLWHPR